MPDLLFFAFAVIAAVLVGLSKGGLPVIGMLATPVLALAVSPVTGAAILLPIYVVSDMFGLHAYRRDFDRRNLLILVPATSIGVGLGWATASIISERLVTLVVGAIGLAFCFDHYWKNQHRLEPKPADMRRGLFWGAIAGFTSFVSHSGAPPYQMFVLPQRLDKLTYAGTTTILFAYVNALKLIPYWALGQLNAAALKIAALLVLPAIAAVYAGVWLVRVIPEELFYRLVMAALFVVSLKLIWDAAIG
jgi:uncharacterized protein